jgi:hypothetical protein
MVVVDLEVRMELYGMAYGMDVWTVLMGANDRNDCQLM